MGRRGRRVHAGSKVGTGLGSLPALLPHALGWDRRERGGGGGRGCTVLAHVHLSVVFLRLGAGVSGDTIAVQRHIHGITATILV